MPFISIEHAASYDADTSAEILQAVTEAYSSSAGVPQEKVWVKIQEVSREHWATGGTTLAQKDREQKRP